MITPQSSSLPVTLSPGSYGLSASGPPQSGANSNAATEKGKPPIRQSDKVELSGTSKPLTKSEQKEVDELKKRDADVHRHEQAHLAAAGGYARGGASYTYQTGPDGKQYAVGGEVNIDVGEVPNNPRATIEKEQTVQRAALAPADPSGEDHAVAAHAAQIEAKARAELAQSRFVKNSGKAAVQGNLLDVAA